MTETAEVPAVAVLGGGLMGHGIAQAFASAQVQVQIWDPDSVALESIPTRVRANLARIAQVTNQTVDADGIIKYIRPVTSLEDALAGASFAFEAAPEQLPLKQDILRRVQRANPDVIFATNTSVLRIGDIVVGAERPERVIGAHWWNPPYLIPVVEVVPSSFTALQVTAALAEFLTKIGKQPVLVRQDVPGFIGNRLQFALWREALHLVEAGICDAEAVDTVVRNTFGLRLASVGPLENADFIGLDLVEAIMNYVLPSLASDQGTSEIVRVAVSRGHLGAKTDQGIFEWAPGRRSEVEDRLTSGILRALDGGGGE